MAGTLRVARLGIGAAGIIALLWKLYASVLRFVIRRNAALLTSGEVEPMLRWFARDATLVLEGDHSWAGEHRGTEAIGAFLQRFVRTGIRGRVHEIVIQGSPWNTLAVARFTDHAADERGAIVYENHALILARIVWGRIVHQQVYEDTQSVARLDRYLAEHGRG
jgi:ketosteroid isomerase-like protein